MDIEEQILSTQLKEVSERTLRANVDAFTPILISRKTRKNYPHEERLDTHPFMSIGTGIFITYKDCRWFATAKHVIDNLRNEHFCAPIYLRMNSRITMLCEKATAVNFVECDKEDIALVCLTEIDNPSIDFDNMKFIDIDNLAEKRAEDSLRVGIYGYLRKFQKSVGNEINPSQYLTRVGAMDATLDSPVVELEFNRRKFEGDVIDNNIVPQPNGLSGGPVFALGSVHDIAKCDSHIGVFCGLFQTQSDKGANGKATYARLRTIKACMTDASDKLGL